MVTALPLIQAVSRYAELCGNLGDGITAFDDFPDGFLLEFRGITLAAHGLPPMLKL